MRHVERQYDNISVRSRILPDLATMLRVAFLQFVLTLSCLSSSSVLATAQSISVMSYNLRLSLASDGEDAWDARKPDVAQLIQHYQPHFLGVQEALPQQVDYLDSALVNFAYIGVGRDDGERGGEFSAIYYDTTRFALLAERTVWLSPKPETPGKGWDAAYPRVCTYGSFVDRWTRDTVWVFNTHFDHVGELARQESADLIIETISRVVGPRGRIILTGDFNLEPRTAPMQKLAAHLTDTHTHALHFYGPEGTFNGFKLDEWPSRRIDYVFTRGFKIASTVHIDDRRHRGGRWISDHLPVLAVLHLAD